MTVVYWPWMSVATWSWAALTTRGWQCPVLVTPIPAVKSRWRRPASSYRWTPSPRAASTGVACLRIGDSCAMIAPEYCQQSNSMQTSLRCPCPEPGRLQEADVNEFDTARAAVEAVPKRLFIGGEWRDAGSGRTFEVEDPATGKTLCSVADATPADGVAAMEAAAAAQPAWARTAPRARGEILFRAHDLLMARREELAALMTSEMGKPLAESRGEVAYAAEFFRWFAEEAVRIGGDYAVAPDGGSRFLVLRQPVGPCLLVTPWNFPMAMARARSVRPSRPAAR